MTKVNCGTCTACCRHQTVILFPQVGDDPMLYPHLVEVDGMYLLPQKEDGACDYLGDHGCTIYDKRPAICRAYDCRMDFLITARELRELVRQETPSRHKMFEAGEERLGSLAMSEWSEARDRRDGKLTLLIDELMKAATKRLMETKAKPRDIRRNLSLGRALVLNTDDGLWRRWLAVCDGDEEEAFRLLKWHNGAAVHPLPDTLDGAERDKAELLRTLIVEQFVEKVQCGDIALKVREET